MVTKADVRKGFSFALTLDDIEEVANHQCDATPGNVDIRAQCGNQNLKQDSIH